MKEKKELSTGETVDLLNEAAGQKVISRSTISRWFDQGKLSGWKNPLTGDRWIDPESLESILKKLKDGK
jgi:predicted site-specific integrase-resolvase